MPNLARPAIPFPVALVLILVLGFALGLGPVVHAQGWAGGAVLGLEVQGGKNTPVAGARVSLEFVEGEGGGPPAVVTDSQGRAVVVSLAEGRWRMRVEVDQYSSYLAILRLKIGKKVEVIAGPIRDGTKPPLKVEFQKITVSDLRGAQGEEDQRRAEQRAAERIARQRQQRPEPEPVPPIPSPPPPTPEPAPPADPAEPMTVKPTTPEPEPAKVEPVIVEPAIVEPPMAESEEPMAEDPGIPEPAPPEPAAVEPMPQVPAAPPTGLPPPPAPALAKPGFRSELRFFTEPNCPGCKPGEWALIIEQEAGPRSGGDHCPSDRPASAALRQLLDSPGGDLGGYVGPLLDTSSGRPIAGIPAAAQGALARDLLPFTEPDASCQALMALLPAGTRFTGYRYEARDAGGGGDCLADQACPIGEAVWKGHPRVEKASAEAGSAAVLAVFENRSRTERRTALLIVYFTAPRSWQP